jgi:nicotinate-nucleotide adenylyltransferase
VFGGTFDPPHRWHVKVATAVRARLFGPRGWIVFVPAARSPLKSGGPAAPAKDRVAMLRLATRAVRNAAIWTDEIDRARRVPSYTIDTLERLEGLLPASEVRLLIGADQAAAFHRWKDWVRVMVLALPVVVWRPPIDTPRRLRRALAAWCTPVDAEFWLSLVVPAPVDPMSSTDARDLLARQDRAAAAALKRMLDPAVLRYIRSRGLYSGGARSPSAAIKPSDARKTPRRRTSARSRAARP